MGPFDVAAGGRTGDAMLEVLVQQVQAHTLQRFADGGHLCEYIDAVGVFVDQPLQAADLTLDALEPRQHLLLVG